MTAYQPEQWHDMFVAMAGAAAALTGLIFVAVSINLERVLKFPALPPRAVETLSILVGLLVLSVFVLIPGQSLTALGAEILVLGVILGTALLVKRIRLPRAAGQPLTWTVTPVG
jgi:modulator of FtsH protease